MGANKLDELIPQYMMNKSEMEGYKKICDKENAEIKAIMKELSIDKYETGQYKASYIVQKRESMNEEMLLEILNKNIPSNVGIVKTKEYIDFDMLEKAIYDGRISKEVLLMMDKAKEVKEVVTLRVSKVKDKKSE